MEAAAAPKHNRTPLECTQEMWRVRSTTIKVAIDLSRHTAVTAVDSRVEDVVTDQQ